MCLSDDVASCDTKQWPLVMTTSQREPSGGQLHDAVSPVGADTSSTADELSESNSSKSTWTGDQFVISVDKQ